MGVAAAETAAAAASIGAAPPSLPTSAASASGTRRIVGESAVIAIRASVTVPSVDGDDGRRADDGDLHLAPVLEPEVGAARAVGRSGNLDRDEQLVGRGRRGAGTRPEVVDRDLRSSPSGDCSVAVAPKQISGPPVSIAGEAFITLPPIVPCARVAWEPTIAQASASAVKRARTSALRGDLAMARERAETQASVAERLDAVELGDAVDRDDAVRERRLARSGRRRRGRCRRRPGGRRLRARRARRRPMVAGAEGAARSLPPASQTRSGVIGSWCTRAPITLAIAFATAPAVGTHGGSPTPFEPFGPAFGVSVSIQAMSISRRVGGGHELVVGQVRVALAPVGVELRSLGQRLADPHHDAAVDLAVGADLVEDRAAVVRRGDLEHADDAGAAVDPAPAPHARSAAARGTTRARAARRSPRRGTPRARPAPRRRPCRGTCRRRPAPRS